MEVLVKNLQNMDVDQQQPQREAKRSLVQEFLEEEVQRNKKSMASFMLQYDYLRYALAYGYL